MVPAERVGAIVVAFGRARDFVVQRGAALVVELDEDHGRVDAVVEGRVVGHAADAREVGFARVRPTQGTSRP